MTIKGFGASGGGAIYSNPGCDLTSLASDSKRQIYYSVPSASQVGCSGNRLILLYIKLIILAQMETMAEINHVLS